MSLEHERFLKMCVGRDFTVHITEAMESRLRAHVDRVNRDLDQHERRTGQTPIDRFDPDDDVDIIITLLACADRGLEAGERDDGVVGTPWGEIRSREQVDEERRRRG